MQSTIKNRTIFCADNVRILRGIDSGSIDLVYLDPPFNTKRVFSAPAGSMAEGSGFRDRFGVADLSDEWLTSIKERCTGLSIFLEAMSAIEGIASAGSNTAYLAYMALRLLEIHRVLRGTGSVYLHCDPRMSHYLKIMLDIIFGERNFRNEIVWYYGRSKGYVASTRTFPRKHDILFLYTKNAEQAVFHIQREKETRSVAELKRKYAGDYFYCDDAGAIHWSRIKHLGANFVERWRRKFATHFGREPMDGDSLFIVKDPLLKSVWTDIHALNPSARSKERNDFPTQKPLQLLERIIRTSSNEGDIVLDPFCGSATSCVAAERLGRKWIGIDLLQSSHALLVERLHAESAQHAGAGFREDVYSASEPPLRTDINARTDASP